MAITVSPPEENESGQLAPYRQIGVLLLMFADMTDPKCN